MTVYSRFFALAALLLVSLCPALPANAQSKKEMAAKDAQLEERLGLLESRFLTGDPAAERLLRRMDELEASMRALTGELEQVRYERDSLRKDVQVLAAKLSQFEAFEGEFRSHLATVDAAVRAPAASAVSSPSSAAALPSGIIPSGQPGTLGAQMLDMSELPKIGRDRLLAGDFSGAEQAFRQYTTLNPSAPDVGEAYFWLGESLYVRSGFAEAADAYVASMQANETGPKAPNAMVSLAAALRSMGNKQGACAALDSFPAQFPNAPADVKTKAATERARAGC